jgi:hypothetical protein
MRICQEGVTHLDKKLLQKPNSDFGDSNFLDRDIIRMRQAQALFPSRPPSIPAGRHSHASAVGVQDEKTERTSNNLEKTTATSS